MEAERLKTIEDLKEAWIEDERVELINGEIVKRPMARYEHGRAQGRAYKALDHFERKKGPDGWLLATAVSVYYSEHRIPTHDIAGWRIERLTQEPTGVVQITPDWVGEIVSPGHESKDTLRNFNTLMHFKVPYYWLIWPEDEALIAYKSVESKYLVIETIEGGGKVRIEPFEEIEFDLDYVFGRA